MITKETKHNCAFSNNMWSPSKSIPSCNSQLHMSSDPSSSGGKKKKRRRRKTESKKVTDDVSDELPEFDLPEFDVKDDEPTTMMMDQSSMAFKDSSDGILELSNSDISSAISSSAKPQSSTVKGLLRTRNRSIEDTFEFDDVKQPLPQFGAVADDDTTSLPGMGKKRAKTEARKAAAIETARLQEDEDSNVILDFLSSLPFLKNVSDKNPVKYLEYGGWIGIFLLVLWEIYLSSPLFTRAESIIPVVF